MVSVQNAGQKWLSRALLQRAHGIVLIFLGVALAIATTYSEKTGSGLYPFLREVPIAQVGLIQAYLLMAVLGGTVAFGSSGANGDWRWSVVTIIAHCVPLLAVFMYWSIFAPLGQANTPYMSMAIHFTWISIDLGAIFLLKRNH